MEPSRMSGERSRFADGRGYAKRALAAVLRAAVNVTGAALALGIILFSFASTALANPKEEVAEVTQTWARALGEDDPDKVLPLYADDAVLWGTLSPTVRAERAALRDYFVTAFRILPDLKVAFRRPADPRVWQHRGQHRILYILLQRMERRRACPRATALPISRTTSAGSLWITTKKKDVVWFALNDDRPSPAAGPNSRVTGAPINAGPRPSPVYGFLTTAPNAINEPTQVEIILW
jgi:SnoaL-like domain